MPDDFGAQVTSSLAINMLRAPGPDISKRTAPSAIGAKIMAASQRPARCHERGSKDRINHTSRRSPTAENARASGATTLRADISLPVAHAIRCGHTTMIASSLVLTPPSDTRRPQVARRLAWLCLRAAASAPAKRRSTAARPAAMGAIPTRVRPSRSGSCQRRRVMVAQAGDRFIRRHCVARPGSPEANPG